MDIQRFKTVNTAKGTWSLLDLLSSTGSPEEKPAVVDNNEAVAVKSQMGIAEIQRAVREVAAGIIGEILEGDMLLITSKLCFKEGSAWHDRCIVRSMNSFLNQIQILRTACKQIE